MNVFFEWREMKSHYKSQNCTRLHRSCLLTLGHHASPAPRKSPSLRGKEEWGHQLSCAIPARKQRKVEPQRTPRATGINRHASSTRLKANDSVDQRPFFMSSTLQASVFMGELLRQFAFHTKYRRSHTETEVRQI